MTFTPDQIDAMLGATPAPALSGAPAQQPPQAQPQAAPGSLLTDEELDGILKTLPSASASTAPAPAASAGHPSTWSPQDLDAMLGSAPAAQPAASGSAADGEQPSVTDAARYDAAGQIGGAILTGAAKAGFEVRDFLAGKPEEADKSEFRKGVESLDRSLGQASMANTLASGMSQFAVGMLGAGKLLKAAEGVSAIGSAVGALRAVKGGEAAISAGKAAAVGAVAFDPNGGRLSDLIQGTFLANPVNEFLASKADDTPAMGRMKNALESIGLDAAVAATFAASVRGFKAVQAYRAGEGSAEAVHAATDELNHAVNYQEATRSLGRGDSDAFLGVMNEHPEAAGAALNDHVAVQAQARDEVAASRPVLDAEAAARDRELAAAPTDDVTVSGEAQTVAPPSEGQTTIPAETPKPSVQVEGVSEAQLSRLMGQHDADLAALTGPGGWEGAIARGYRFGDGGRIPWQKFAELGGEGVRSESSPFDNLLARVADEFKADIDRARGGQVDGVLSDAEVEKLVAQRAALGAQDPEALLGHVELAGHQARTMVANMRAADLLTARAVQDAANLHERIKGGFLEEFGGDAGAARDALMKTLEMAARARAASEAMQASAGRTLRMQRTEFGYTPADIAQMRSLTPEQFASTMDAMGHDLAVASRVLRPGFWAQMKDAAQTLYVNNLLWGLRTHFVNTITNSYMLVSRPLERMIGYGLSGAAKELRGVGGRADFDQVAQNWRQYGYIGASLHEAFGEAVRTWKTGESIIAPGKVSDMSAEGMAQSGRVQTNWAAEGYRPWDTTGNIMGNFWTAFMKTASTPTRALGSMDEFAKQLTYRSKVMADASTEAAAQGLDRDAFKAYLRSSLDKAFDDAGRAVNAPALYESEMATFQQALAPGSLGAWVQQGVNQSTVARFIVPFVKTPTNVLRMGWKLTPGLNLLQKEYREMIQGLRGEEQQAQAIGHMALGSTFLGTAAFLAHAGYITGGGPSDPKLAATLKATGWQPYSFVIPNADGSKTYVNYGRYDPVAMPFGIVADIIDITERDQDGDGFAEKAGNAAQGLFLGLIKQMAQKTYLTSLHDTINAITDPDRSAGKVVRSTAANFVPFSSGLRNLNTDPHVREVRGVVDGIMAIVPGLSDKLPPQRDAFGDPLTVHKGLWVNGSTDAVDWEVSRMIDESVMSPIGPPSATTVHGLDLRDIETRDGRNAFDKYQELAGHPARGPSLKERLASVMHTPAYQRAPDGDVGVKGTRAAIVAGTIAKYREAAMRQIQADPNVRAAIAKRNAESRAAVVQAYAPKGNREEGARQLEAVGKSFGVDLSGLVPSK